MPIGVVYHGGVVGRGMHMLLGPLTRPGGHTPLEGRSNAFVSAPAAVPMPDQIEPSPPPPPELELEEPDDELELEPGLDDDGHSG